MTVAPGMVLRRVAGMVLVLAVLACMSPAVTATARASSEPEDESSEGIEEHIYVRLDAITVTLFDEDGVVGLYTVAPTLEIADQEQRTLVSEKGSQLRDAMFTALHSLVARRKTKRIPLDAVKVRLRTVAQRMLGEDVVIDLFVENVLRKDT